MRQVQEVIYLVPEERDAFLQFYLEPSEDLKQVLWLSGVRNQFFYELEDYILEAFEYVGHDFYKDMAKLSVYLEKEGKLVEHRRRDVPADQLDKTSWWAPLKKLGSAVTKEPTLADGVTEKEEHELYREMTSGYMDPEEARSELAYSDDDWSESVHF